MKSVWIVYQENASEDPIMGVFLDAEEAESFASGQGHAFPDGLLLSEFPIPWRRGDGGVAVAAEVTR